VETLNAVFGRDSLVVDEIKPLLSLLFSQESLQLLQNAFVWADVQATNIDEARYTFLKRHSEVRFCMLTLSGSVD
jgi:hypothetical protein